MIGQVLTRSGAQMPAVGQGTWRMGEDPRRRREEVKALQLGFDLGMTLVDTAEMYADGGAEGVVAEAIRGRRDEVFVVTKVLPQNASYDGTIEAAERSLKRLGTGWVDLYLLHWPGSHPLEGTLEAFGRLAESGKIRHYGLSNFNLEEMKRAEGLHGGIGVAVDQVLYNLERRGMERHLLPWCAERRIALMAYSPFEQARLRQDDVLIHIARRHAATAMRVALAWTIRYEEVMAIPKASKVDHVRDNAAAADLCLTEEDLYELERVFPPPAGDAPFEML